MGILEHQEAALDDRAAATIELNRNSLHPVLLNFQVGTIRILRLMVDFKGQNRGFGFITYETAAAAQKAVRDLNRGFFRPHK